MLPPASVRPTIPLSSASRATSTSEQPTSVLDLFWQRLGARTPLGRDSWVGRAVLEKRTLHDDVAEVMEQAEGYPVTALNQRKRIEEEGDSSVPRPQLSRQSRSCVRATPSVLD